MDDIRYELTLDGRAVDFEPGETLLELARREGREIPTLCHDPRLAPAGVNPPVKVEAFNPLGAMKDRLSLGVIEAAEKSGKLKPGQTVVEATSAACCRIRASAISARRCSPTWPRT